MLLGITVSDALFTACGGAIVAVIMAVANAYAKVTKANVSAKVEATESETHAASSTFREMQTILRGQTTRIAYLDGKIDEMRETHAAEIKVLKDTHAAEIRELKLESSALRDEVETCKTERAKMTERIEWLEGNRETRTKSDEIRIRPKPEMP